MTICDENLRAVVGAIANAIGYVEGSKFLKSVPELDERSEEALIAPKIFKTTPLGELDPVPNGYVVPTFGRGAVRANNTQRLYVPAFEINASEPARIASWDRGDEELAEVRRMGTAERMLVELERSLLNSQEKLIVDLLTKVVSDERQIIQWETSRKDILARLKNGWTMLLPCAHPGLAVGLRGLGIYRQWDSPHVDENLAFLCGPPDDLGVWRRPTDDVPVMAWADGQKLTFGLSAYVLRGVGILNPGLLIGVELGECPEVD